MVECQLPKRASQSANTAESTVSEADPSSNASLSRECTPTDADLRRLMDAWPALPEPIRAGILAMVAAAAGPSDDGDA